jgi:hypothetical protein
MIGDMNREFSNGNTPLFPACGRGHVGIVKALIGKGADVNHANKRGETPLLLACRRNSYGVVKVLIESGADVHYTNKGQTALTMALSMYNFRRSEVSESRCIVRFLLENTSIDLHKGVIKPLGYDFSTNALNFALKNGLVRIAKLLLRHGAIPDKPDQRGLLPLCSALGNLESTKYFLDTFPDAATRPITVLGGTTLQFVLFDIDVPMEVFREVLSRKVVDVLGEKMYGQTALECIGPGGKCLPLPGLMRRFNPHELRRKLARVLPYLLYERDTQRLTEICRVFFMVERQRASVVPHVLQNTCLLSPDLLEELSEYMAPRPVVQKHKRAGCECGYC